MLSASSNGTVNDKAVQTELTK